MLSISFFYKTAAVFIIGLLYLSGHATAKEGERFNVAVLPVENLSGTSAPLKDIRQSLMERLKTQGSDVLEEEVLKKFMTKYRVRYVGGINRAIAQAFKEETGAEAVLITSLELYKDRFPPKIALTSRLVSTGDNPVILWADSTGMAGHDSPGVLGLGVIKTSQKLTEKAIGQLSRSLTRYLSGKREGMDLERGRKKFQPKIYYRSPVLDPDRKYTVAVIPFVNLSHRKNAGEIVVLHFVRQLSRLENFSVIEPGLVRQGLLRWRIIMDDGISLAHAGLIFKKLDADLILTGKVIDYQDYQGSTGKPKVDFSTLVMERGSREVVWSSKSYNEGDDDVILFDWGKVNTAHKMATEMARVITEMMVK